ncbi:MAG: AAA family ATPase [Alphaproteobacteria bacterium]|nr:AAA family ATPase [Alphaproteobacteria bacterium]
MHGNPEFWSGNEGYVDFPRDRFLEYTDDHLKNEFQALDQNVVNRLKTLPTLFAVEHENADTRVGKVTDIEVQPRNLRVYYQFNDKQNQLTKGTLEAQELRLDADKYEFYRTHWALKEANLNDFLKERSKTLEGIFDKIKQELDTPNPEKPDHTKLMVLYATNSSGKTRISKRFADQYDEQVLYYNAFTEDLFSWDNENYILKIDNRAWIFRFIEEQGLDRQIIDRFQEFTGSKLEPFFEIPEERITFRIRKGDDGSTENIKISRGEESVFIWSVFYAILDVGIDALNAKAEDRSTPDFDNIQYIVIDDPVSSMDDTRIITVALELAKLIKKSKNQLKFLITTHHALFFNVLFNVRGKNWDRKNYILSKSGAEFILKGQGSESPFAYHHVAMADIEKAIKDKDIKKYHFNIFRALLEKTANFLGYDSWKMCLTGSGHSDAFAKIIDHYSHDRLSDLEYRDITNDEKVEFVEAFNFFTDKYFKQEVITNG